MAKTENNNHNPIWKFLKYTRFIISFLIGTLYLLGWVFNDAENVREGIEQMISMSWVEVIIGILFVVVSAALALYIIYASKMKALEAVEDKYSDMMDRVNKSEKQIQELKEIEKLTDKVSDNESSIKVLENNHLIQRDFNKRVAELLSDEDFKLYEIAVSDNHNYIKELVKQRNNERLSGQQAIRISSNFKFKPESFHEPY